MTRDSDTTFKVKRSKVNLQGAGEYCGSLPHNLYILFDSFFADCLYILSRAKRLRLFLQSCLFLLNYLHTVAYAGIIQVVLRAQNSVYLAKSAATAVWQQSISVFNKLQKDKLINSFNYCLQKKALPLELHYSDIIVMSRTGGVTFC